MRYEQLQNMAGCLNQKSELPTGNVGEAIFPSVNGAPFVKITLPIKTLGVICHMITLARGRIAGAKMVS
jgi:hypothetical protein